jgi:hypothetical protein
MDYVHNYAHHTSHSLTLPNYNQHQIYGKYLELIAIAGIQHSRLGLKIPRGSSLRVGSSPTSGTIFPARDIPFIPSPQVLLTRLHRR